MDLILKEEYINSLSRDTKLDLLLVLYRIEDELDYNCKDVSETINYLQEII